MKSFLLFVLCLLAMLVDNVRSHEPGEIKVVNARHRAVDVRLDMESEFESPAAKQSNGEAAVVLDGELHWANAPGWNLLNSWTAVYDLEKLNRHLTQDHGHPSYDDIHYAWGDHDRHHNSGWNLGDAKDGRGHIHVLTKGTASAGASVSQPAAPVIVSDCPPGVS